MVAPALGSLMGKDDGQKNAELSPKEQVAAKREERLRKQLRDNLKKRKAQARNRSTKDSET
ncbi:MAG: hypothetical protein AAF393_11275 [Pseudomonadota bacterium]